ncbi:hypothetical protein [Streptomyces niveus]|uniref:hypothetical protein n=1 Tax=Streptomyces niveus TaxID=193462 RepID=UPI0003C5A4AD|nr:hypothetical protein [Streptomyces niveus]EST17943.1 hypothetical protein M877_39745 [Streptomyces niveus NCIMB 11891]
MIEWVTTVATMVVSLGTVAGVLAAVVRKEFGMAVVRLLAGMVALVVLSNFGPLRDWFEGALDGGHPSKPAADSHPKSDDGSSLWLPLTFGAVGLAVSFGGYGLWSLIQRRRTRKAAQRAADTAAQERRRAIEAEHDEVLDAHAAYLCDVLAVLDRPALDDVTVPQTAALLHALDTAADARRGGDLNLYRPAVSQLKTAWRAADEHARKTGLRHLPRQERATVTRARGLLEIALDGNGGEHERRAAYAKARELLDGVLTLPRQAVAAVETRTRPALVKDATA